MKKITFLLFLLITITTAFAQAPQSFNYSGVARNNVGTPLANQGISIRASILDVTPTGTVLYSETQAATTNQFGLFTIAIGTGTPTTGTLSAIPWASANKYLKIEFDPNGGSSYILSGTTQMLSVPYALYAEKSGDNMWKKAGNSIYYTANVGIGKIPQSDVSLDVAGNYIQIGKDSAGTQGLVKNIPLNTPGYDGSLMIGFDPAYGTISLHHQLGGYGGGVNSDNFFTTFNTTEGGISTGERMRITPSGNVAIGLTNPTEKLTVQGSINTIGGYYKTSCPPTLTDYATGENSALIYDSRAAGTQYPFLNSGNLILQSWPQANRDILFVTGISPTAKMIIGSGGNVGIGTLTAPSEKLSVAGVIESTTGGIKFPDGTTQITAAGGGGGVPVGTILPFAGTTPPPGFLICDGAPVSRTTYAGLFSVLGSAYGNGDGSSTFHLPDLRGRFMRGVDGPAGNDPDNATRTASNVGGNTGNNVGSMQTDKLSSHSHTLSVSGGGGNTTPSTTTAISGDATVWTNSVASINNTVSINSFGGNETRPKNVNVNFIIKY